MSGVITALTNIIEMALVVVGGVAALSLRHLAPPASQAFARPRTTSSNSNALYSDNNATFLYDRGFMFRRRWWFTATGCPPVRLDRQRKDELLAAQWQEPVPVMSFNSRAWWLFEGNFYWEAAGFTAQDVLALVRDRERRHQSRLERAHMALRMEQQPQRRRGQLPKALKLAVYERDGGCCVQCGSAFDLQYDHIIPVAMGGATTLENLQLLCSACNQAKGANL